jgi:hypothetical protein
LPRWRAPGRHEVEGFVPGQDIVVTHTPKENVDEEEVALRRFSWWDLKTGKELRFVETACWYHAFSPDYRLLAAGAGKDMWIIHTESGRRVDVPGEWQVGRHARNDFSFSASGRLMSRSWCPGGLAVIDTETGSHRKRQTSSYGYGYFLPHSERLLCRLEDKDGISIHFWDSDTNQVVHALGPYDNGHWASRTGRYHFGVGKSSNAPSQAAEMFDSMAGRKVLEFRCRYSEDRDEWFSIPWSSTDEHCFAAFYFDRQAPKWKVEFWDIPAKKKISSVQPASNSNDGGLSPDGSLFVFHHRCHFGRHPTIQSPPFHLQVYDVATGEELWRRTSNAACDWPVDFSSDSRRLCVREADVLKFFDARSGALLSSRPCFRDFGFLCPTDHHSWDFPHVSPTRRFPVMTRSSVKRKFIIPFIGSKFALAETDEITVADLDQERILAQLQFDQRGSSELCERGPVLVTSHREGEHWHLAAWDLPPARPWLAIVGIPALAGLALVGMKAGYRRWRARRAKTP